MQEQALRDLIENVRLRQLPRRSFIQRLVGLGLTAPMASMLLLDAGIAQVQTAPPYKGTKRGGGGSLKMIAWQGPVHLNPHFAGAIKELLATRIFYKEFAFWMVLVVHLCHRKLWTNPAHNFFEAGRLQNVGASLKGEFVQDVRRMRGQDYLAFSFPRGRSQITDHSTLGARVQRRFDFVDQNQAILRKL